MAYQKMKMMEHVGLAHTSFDLSTAIYIYSGNKEMVSKCEDEKMIGNRKDVLELDELSDACLKANFGYTDAGIENPRDQAKEIRKEEEVA